MKRILLTLLTVALSLCLLAACSSGNDGSPAAAAPAEFDFALDTSEEVALTIVGEIENFEALEAIIAEFEELYPNCHITYSQLDDYNNTIGKRLANDTAATSMFISTSGQFSGEDSLAEYAVDYLDYDNVGVSLDGANQRITYAQQTDGKLYTVPLATIIRGMVVNKTLLEQHNLAMPGNYQEFIDVCAALKAAGLTPIQANPNYYGHCMFYPLIANTVVHSDQYETELKEINEFTEGSSQYFAEAFEKLDYLVANGYVEYEGTKEFKDNYDAAIMNFFEGDVAFFPCTAETVSGMAKREERSEAFTAAPFEYEFTSCPVGDDGAYCYWQAWSGISINPQSDHENWSRAFVNYLLQQDNLAQLAEIKGMPANTQEASADPRFASLFTADENHITETSKFTITVYAPLNNTMIGIVYPAEDQSQRFDKDAALAHYETLIAEKRAAAAE